MRSYPNIDKSAFRRKRYVGYAASCVWTIWRDHSTGLWNCGTTQNGGHHIKAQKTLGAVSDALTAYKPGQTV